MPQYVVYPSTCLSVRLSVHERWSKIVDLGISNRNLISPS